MRLPLQPLLRALRGERADLERCLPRGLTVVDLGCGRAKLAGAIGVDRAAHAGVDVVLDVEAGPLPFEDGSVDIVFSDQFLEHVKELPPLVLECHRVLRAGGAFIARVPYFRSSYAFIDPTHVRCFTINSMDYYVAGTDLHAGYRFFEPSFRELHRVLHHRATGGMKLAMEALAKLALRDPHWFEHSPLSATFPFTNISYCLVK